MIYEAIILETIKQALRGLDKIIVEENAEEILKKVDSWENHKLLQNNRTYVISKGWDNRLKKDVVKVFYCQADNITFEEQPLAIDISKILDEIRSKCIPVLPEDSQYLIENQALIESSEDS